MKSKELIQAHINFLEQNMKHDSVLKSSLINDDMLEIEAYKKVLKDLEILDILKNKLKDDISSVVAKKRFFNKISCEDEEAIRKWLNGK